MRSVDWKNLNILITGGTGSFGHQFVETVLQRHEPRRLIVFSRDELKQHDMRKRFPDHRGSPMRYFIGDVRDADRLRRAFHGVDLVVHAAALKQVPSCEYNPFEAVMTNVMGAKNVIDAAIDCGVERVLALSTDKAVNPVNLYGATKLVAEKLFIQGNAYSGGTATRFACVRYGNVVGSRGSVVPLFLDLQKRGLPLPVTHPDMTRFWITLSQGVEFVLQSVERMQGGEIFVPKLGAAAIMDLAKSIAGEGPIEISGIRPGEKLHERLLAEEEIRSTVEADFAYIVQAMEDPVNGSARAAGTPVPQNFQYSSDACRRLDAKELNTFLNPPDRHAKAAHTSR